MEKLNTFGAHSQLKVGKHNFQIWRLDALDKAGLPVARLPFSLKILLENLLRTEDDSPDQSAVARRAGDRSLGAGR
jgi:aconitate hydratase